MDSKEILQKITALDEDGTPSSVVGMVLVALNPNDKDDIREVANVACNQAYIDINIINGLVMIDLEFKSDFDVELKKMWDTLEKFKEMGNEYAMKEDAKIPVFSLTFVPMEERGKIYAVTNNPLFWSLTAKEPGKAVSTIRILFNGKDMEFFEAPDMNISDIETEVAVEVNKRKTIESDYDRRRQIRQEKMEELDAMLYGDRRY